jgi:hypothetical protein
MLAGFAASLWFLWWTWFAQELSPLERYYWPTYFTSTEGAKHPGSTTLIAPLFLTAPGRKSEIVLAPDVVRGRTGNLPLRLSQSAVERGWKGIERARPIWDDSAAIEDFLREDFYAGRGFWHMTMEPMLDGCAYVLAWIVIAIVFVRQGLATEWKELWTVLTETYSTSDDHWDWPGNRRGITGRIRWRWNVREWVENLSFRPVRTVLQSRRPIDAKRAEAIRGDIGRDQPSSSAPIPPDPARSRPATKAGSTPDSPSEEAGQTALHLPRKRGH